MAISRWLWCALLLACFPALANLPGGGTNGANVTLTDNGTTVAISNGIVSILCSKSGGSLSQINYTFNNSGSKQTLNLLSGGNNGGSLYWENSSSESLAFTYSLVASPTNTGGNYAEIALTTTSVANDVLEVHFSMLRGGAGFYVTALYGHRSTDGAFGMGECRDNIYAGSIFNWMSVDARRNRLMEVSGGSAIAVYGAPKEVTLWTDGIYAGQYEDKYKYSADLGVQRVWGWSSVGTGGKNVGLWNISASSEYYNGGPLKPELMEHIGTTILNMLNGGHYGMGSDGTFVSGEVWTKVCGPYFIFCNNVTNTLTGTNAAAQALYSDALAQGVAEQGAWPYAWFTNANYAPATNRGTVTGRLAINDSGNPNATAAGLWVGLIQQPATASSIYDFQQCMKPYQFWSQSDAGGIFAISNVIAGTNYTLWAFGPGTPDTFLSQAQTGGTPPLIVDLPASPFAVTANAGGAANLGAITWTPTRTGATVFEIGYPDRLADKFRHGDDWWVGDIGPAAATPSPIWSKWLEYPVDFPNGLNYVVGQSRWTTDWNFIQPVVTSSAGAYNNSSATITFNLASAPTNGAAACLYLGFASDYDAAIIVSVNGNNLAGVSGVSGAPNNSIPSTGFYTGYDDSDTSIREGNNAAFSDERITFPASLLSAGANTITLAIRQVGGSYFANHAMYDYLRLEITGYVPPPPAGVTACAGNGCNLVTWPVTPGATRYNLLRSTAAGSGFAIITNGVTGPVCGCGSNNAVYLDTTAVNGTTYYYEVQSVNPTGSSTNSPASAGATPLASLATNAPAAASALAVTGSGHQSVTLAWNAAAGANFYSVWRSTLVNTGGGSSNTLSTIILNNNNTGTTYTDNSPTDGSIYRYFVTATSAGGTSANSAAVAAVPRPTAPASAPFSFTGAFASTNITLTWSAVSGAVGYVIYRATSASGPYTLLVSLTETTYTDYGLSASSTYYYKIVAINAGGVSATVTNSVNGLQPAPASLSATGTNAQIFLTWSAATNAASYTLLRGASAGAETTTVVSGYTGTTYTNTGLVNGNTYYYAVTATSTNGTSGKSAEASATASAAGNGTWIADADGNWSTGANWSGEQVAYGAGYTADFSTLTLSTNHIITLDSDRTLSGLKFGSGASAFNWTLAGTNTLTLGASPSINVLNQTSTLSTVIAGSAGLVKSGPGTLVLGGATETVSNGLAVNAGRLVLDFSAANSPAANLLPAANALTLAGGALQIIGGSNAVSTQTFSATTLNAGAAVISAAPVAGTNTPVITLGAINANTGGLIEFTGPATIGSGGKNVASNALLTTTLGGNSAFVGGTSSAFNSASFATVGLYDFAATTNAAAPYVVVGGSQISGFYTSASGTAAAYGNLDVTGNITGWSGQPYITSLRFNTNWSASITVAAYSTFTLADILVTPNAGAYNVSINNNNLRPGGGNTTYTGPYVIWQNNSAGELVINSTLGNSKAGSAPYLQAGPGTVSITGTASGYLGQSYLNGGFTLISGNGSIGSAATGAAVNLNGGTLVAGGTFALDNGGANPRPVTVLGNGGGLAAIAGATLTVDGMIGSGSGAGPLAIGIPALSANNNVAGRLPGTGAGTANASPIQVTGTVVLTNANYYTGGTVLQSGTLNFNGLYALGGANYGGVTFNGGTLQYAAGFSGNNGSGDLTATGTASLTLAAGGGTIDLNSNSVTFAGALGNGGSGSLTVKNGTLTLQGSNSYTGATIITNATLLASNSGGSATGAGSVTVQNGGVLAGTGAIGGSVTVSASGKFVPGNPLGTLTVGNALTLAASSTTVIQIQHSPLTNSAVSLSGTFTAGGTFIVTNTGTAALANGDRFQLFSAASYAGAFSGLVLPGLATNLVWNTNTLLTGGTLAVVTLASPAIASLQISGADLVFSGSGGASGWPYLILAATNLAPAQWTPAATNHFDSSGNFNLTLTNALNAGQPRTFYKLQLQ